MPDMGAGAETAAGRPKAQSLTSNVRPSGQLGADRRAGLREAVPPHGGATAVTCVVAEPFGDAPARSVPAFSERTAARAGRLPEARRRVAGPSSRDEECRDFRGADAGSPRSGVNASRPAPPMQRQHGGHAGSGPVTKGSVHVARSFEEGNGEVLP